MISEFLSIEKGGIVYDLIKQLILNFQTEIKKGRSYSIS